jgi:outer membrane protein OmpA-like peptidoglycan-associated protein
VSWRLVPAVWACLSASALMAACATVTPTPASLVQAQTLYASLETQHAEQRVEGDMIRARASIDTARTAVSQGQNPTYVEGMAEIALRTVQIADAHFSRSVAQSATDSLLRLKLTRQLAAAQARQAALEVERAELMQRAAAATARADSLRRAADAANAQLEQAMAQLQSLVVEMTNLKRTPRGLVISLSDILFDLGQATLKPGAEASVQKISAVLKQYPDHKISVEGYTDSTGSEAFNQQLSENRAQAVRDALVAGGLDSTAISVHGYGKANPVATNATADGRQQNRRVEIVVLGAGTVGDLVDSRPAQSRPPVDSSRGDSIPHAPASDSTTSHPRAVSPAAPDTGNHPPSDSSRHP